MKLVCSLLSVLLVLQGCVAPPTNKQKENKEHQDENKGEHQEGGLEQLLDIEYNNYLKEVIDALETDPEFRRKLEKAEDTDFRNGKVAAELEFVNHNVRTKLDELKRIELNRLRELVKQAHEMSADGPSHVDINPPEHIDHSNPHSFEVSDLHKLINKVALDLSEADRKRRDEFKEYELQKHFEEQQMLNAIENEQEKEAYLKELQERKKKHAKHEPLHHPGSKAQLEEVWHESDQMNQDFSPKAFFMLHDLDGNGFWDEVETKALFKKELDKMYQAGVPEDDMKERGEEMERMREHVFKETDKDKDNLISYKEFLEHTQDPKFRTNEAWEPIDQNQVYTDKEYKEFEEKRMKEIQKLIEKGVLPPHAHMPSHHGYHHMPQQYQHQYQAQPGHPQIPQQYPQMGHHQQGVGQHPQMQQGMGHHPQMQPGMHPQMQQGMHPQMQQGMHPQMQQGMHPQMQQGQHPQMQQGQHPQMQQGQHPQMQQGMHPQMQQGMHPQMQQGQHPQMQQGQGMHPQMQQGMGQPPQMHQGMGKHAEMEQAMGKLAQEGMGQPMGGRPNSQQGMGQQQPQMQQGMGGHPNAQPGLVQPPAGSMGQGVPQQGSAQQQNQQGTGQQQQQQNQQQQQTGSQQQLPQGIGQNQYQGSQLPDAQQKFQHNAANTVLGTHPKQPLQ